MVKIQTGAQTTGGRIEKMTGARSAETSIAPTPLSADAEPAPITPLMDAYNFNSTFNWVDPSETALPTHIQDLLGESLRDIPVLPHGPNEPGTVAWQMDSGLQQDTSDGIITYTFANWQTGLGVSNNPKLFGQGQGYSPFTAAQIDAGRIAIQNWDDLISAEFVEVSGPGASVFGKNSADIVFSNTTTGPAQAEAYYPNIVIFSPIYQRIQGDVFVADPAINSSNAQFLPGQYGLHTLNHELGHSLGLTHPGTYDFGDDQDGDGQPDPIEYTTDAQYFQDSHQFTIMSYFDAYETGGASIDWNVMRFIYPSTPMVDDVYVIQQKYGADMSTRAGDTTYGWNATVDVTNDALSFEAGDLLTTFTIWDGGGEDTIDLSGYHTDSVIDLREGAYSSAGGWGAYEAGVAALDTLDATGALEIINANNQALGLPSRSLPETDVRGFDYFYKLYFEGNVPLRDANGNPVIEDGEVVLLNEGLAWKDITGAGPEFLMENNIGIAYGAIIENAIGGHGDDRINGNHVDNIFTGNGGADTFIIADHSRIVPMPGDADGVLRIDSSTDTITDFDSLEGDRIDLSSFAGVSWANVTQVYSEGSLTLTIDRPEGSDVQLILQGVSSVSSGDFIFG